MSFGRLGSLGRGFGRLGSGRGATSAAPVSGILAANGGSYAWSGDTMTPLVDYKLPATGGSYAWTGQDATLTATSSVATVYSATAGADNPNNDGFSFRHEIGITNSSMTQVRVSIKASTTQGLVAGHVSIGVSSMAESGQRSSGGETAATPVELLFGGVSGINVGNGVVAVSDWTNFSGIDSTNNAIVIIDITTGGVCSTTSPSNNLPSGHTGLLWFKAATTSWNTQSPASFSASFNDPRSVVLIETQ
jgi:hypothetical protein